uniref:Fibronectin type-III domain-containing protein n=1 Tax=Oncorhynchus kisutch TaxID=8019 RepID=A0A8C7JI51_ONCKI
MNMLPSGVWKLLPRMNQTCPEVPTTEQAYSKQSNSTAMEFTEMFGASGYILQAKFEVGEFFSETMVTSSPGTVLQLQPYTDYTLSVMSVNSGGHTVKVLTDLPG